MLDLDQTIYERLTNSAVNPLVGGHNGAFSSAFGTAFDSGLTAGRIYPVIGAEDTELPCVIYRTELTEAGGHLSGRSGVYVYSLSVDVFAVDHDGAGEIADSVVSTLDYCSGGDVQLCKLKGSSQPQQDNFYQWHAEFSVAVKED